MTPNLMSGQHHCVLLSVTHKGVAGAEHTCLDTARHAVYRTRRCHARTQTRGFIEALRTTSHVCPSETGRRREGEPKAGGSGGWSGRLRWVSNRRISGVVARTYCSGWTTPHSPDPLSLRQHRSPYACRRHALRPPATGQRPSSGCSMPETHPLGTPLRPSGKNFSIARTRASAFQHCIL